MAGSLQAYLAKATKKAADDLVDTFMALPEDKRSWSPSETARTPADQLAECAILTGSTADLIHSRKWTMGNDFSDYINAKAELAKDTDGMVAMLKKNVAKAAEAILATPDSALEDKVEMPWGPMAMADIIAYPYWNMSYHQGQTYYVGSVLGVAK